MKRSPAVLICYECEQVIEGEYDYTKTQRGNMIYFHKSKKCPDKRQGKEEVRKSANYLKE